MFFKTLGKKLAVQLDSDIVTIIYMWNSDYHFDHRQIIKSAFYYLELRIISLLQKYFVLTGLYNSIVVHKDKSNTTKIIDI